MIKRLTSNQGSKGSTLMEMCVVMALFAILCAMIISFSLLAYRFVGKQQSRLSFIGDISDIKQHMLGWLSESDEHGSLFLVDGTDISVDNSPAAVRFDSASGALLLTNATGALSEVRADTVDTLRFELRELPGDAQLLKCTVIGRDAYTDSLEQCFILTLRCGSFADTADQ